MYYQVKNNVLSLQMCETLIKEAHEKGFEPAKVQMYGNQKSLPNIRNNERIEFDDIDLSVQLTKLLKNSLGADFPDMLGKSKFVKAGSHFRMYSYKPGEYFKPHKDGSYEDGKLKSLVTVLFYLNTTDGGETVLMPNGFKEKESWIAVAPIEGSVLLFEHNMFHEGRQVASGMKYVLRTDLFYEEV
jgi:prolyl 4-hydroxylase